MILLTMIIKFKYKNIQHDPPLPRAVIDSIAIKEHPKVSEWCKNLRLVSGYTSKGKFVPHKWQEEPMDAMLNWSKVILVGPTQSGKSLISDMIIYYAMDVLHLEGMVLYETKEKSEMIMRRRIKPMIIGNKILSKNWSGKDSDLTLRDIQLKHCFWGIGSIQNRDDMSSFPAAVICISELSKAKKLEWDIMLEAKGRQQAYPVYKRKIIVDSTPNVRGDPLYFEVYYPGSVILQPHVPCPHCYKYQILVDSQIKLRGFGREEQDHDPVRIRLEKTKSVYYECEYCCKEIDEDSRPNIFEHVVWAKSEIEEKVSDNYTFYQKAEKIDKNGNIDKSRSKMIYPVYNWNRLVNPEYKYWECLASFFEAKRTPEKLRIYLNNDKAEFYTPRNSRLATNTLELKVLQSDYTAFDDDSYIPNDILLLLCGIDTQDDGFYFVVWGFGDNMFSRIVRYGFIECSIEHDNNQDYESVHKKLLAGIFSKPYKMKLPEGEIRLIPCAGFIDRGGHRSKAVDYLVENIPWLECYVGSTHINPKEPLIKKTPAGYYYGQTELLSDLVGAMLMMNNCKFPKDTSNDFINQLIRQYHYIIVDKEGNEHRKYKKGGRDHYRDAMNYIYAMILELGLDVGLFDKNVKQELITARKQTKIIEKKTEGTVQEPKKEEHRIPSTENYYPKNTSYFGRGRW